MKNWNYKVVKFSRGVDGKFFAHKAAATFGDFASACAYALDFWRDQVATLGHADSHEYRVMPRKSSGERMTYRQRNSY